MVAQVVLLEQFPRSVIYSVNRLHRYFEKLKGEGNQTAYKQIDFMIGKIRSRIKFSTAESIANEGLHHFLKETKAGLLQIGNSISRQYFAYS